MEKIHFKLVTANDPELFERRLADFIGSLDRSDVIADVRFATTALQSGAVEYSALVHYQRTEEWS